jgi:FSR family fosmidomycin resistance protein-like MFS transporter
MMTLAGVVLGAVGPARDIIVRGTAPPEARGKVYGFVYSGLDLGGLVAPLVFGWVLDRGHPALIFAGSAAFMLLAVPTVIGVRRVEKLVPSPAAR